MKGRSITGAKGDQGPPGPPGKITNQGLRCVTTVLFCLVFSKKLELFLHQLNFKNKGPVLLSKTTFRH